jgi:hypothetical protein
MGQTLDEAVDADRRGEGLAADLGVKDLDRVAPPGVITAAEGEVDVAEAAGANGF